jgi:hypothetical protein
MNLAYGYDYNNLLLKAQASIFPKIMLLDNKIKDKLIDEKIVYVIAYDKSDYETALFVSKFINEKYKGYFEQYAYKIDLVEFSNLSSETQASAIYILNSGENIKKAANIAKEKGIISFSYDLDNLKRGLLFSLMLEKSTVLYINKENLYTQKVDFVDALLQMVRFIEEGNS